MQQMNKYILIRRLPTFGAKKKKKKKRPDVCFLRHLWLHYKILRTKYVEIIKILSTFPSSIPKHKLLPK